MSELPRGLRHVLGPAGPGGRERGIRHAWKRGAPASSGSPGQARASRPVAGQRAQGVATSRPRARRAAVAESAHLGEVVLLVPAARDERR